MMSNIDIIRARYHQYQELGRAALSQSTEKDLFWIPEPESNSISVLVHHLAGNAHSRFTNFLTTDGQKPDRNRDAEFEPESLTKAELLRRWEELWNEVFVAIDPLTDEDLNRVVRLHGKELTVFDALLRYLVHFAYHVGQIIYIAKLRRGIEWQTLSVPKRKPSN